MCLKDKQSCAPIIIKLYRPFLRFLGYGRLSTPRSLFGLLVATIVTIVIASVIGLIWTDSVSGFSTYFGGILTPILTFLTFMGLLITIILQQKELSLTRKELHISSTALTSQAATQEKQRFEDTFFALLNQHNLILASLNEATMTTKQSTLDGIHLKCFTSDLYDEETNDHTLAYAKKILEKSNHLIGHYFRVLYQLLKLIETKCPGNEVGLEFNEENIRKIPISDEEKFYANLIRSFLNYKITQLLAINCYCKTDNDSYYKYKLLITRYAFLEHMPFDADGETYHIILEESVEHYEKPAFGESIFLERYRNYMK